MWITGIRCRRAQWRTTGMASVERSITLAPEEISPDATARWIMCADRV